MQGLAAGVASVRTRSRLVTTVCFTLVTVTACVLVGQRLTHSSRPLAHARMLLVGFAAVCYFASLVLRARGWHRLFPPEQQPDQVRYAAGERARVRVPRASGPRDSLLSAATRIVCEVDQTEVVLRHRLRIPARVAGARRPCTKAAEARPDLSSSSVTFGLGASRRRAVTRFHPCE